MSDASPVNPYKRSPFSGKVVGTVYGNAGEGLLSKLTEEEIEELRRILLAPEQYQLMQLHRRLDELEAPDAQLGSISKYLPEAVAINARKGDKLAKALAQTFSRTLDVSVQQDTETMVEGISPLIVPALKRGLRESFRSTRNAVKWALQYGVSFQGIRWQIEAMRSQRSFSEVVLSHTIRYRVEQVFLIHRISGLPLQHVVADSVKAQDGSLVSSMLTAIQDFVQDSFGTKAEEGLATLQVGELTVWIEQGPKAILAAVVRGTPEPELRRVLKDTARSIHLQFNAALTFFDGDITPFEATKPILESELLSHYQIPQRPISPLFWTLVGGLAVWLVVIAFFFIRDNVYWNGYLAELQAEPGIVVLESGRENGKWFVRGMKDPLAIPTDSVIVRTSLNPEVVEEHWTPYQDFSEEIIVRRAYQFLGPVPREVTLRIENSVLMASGTMVPKDWVTMAQERAQYMEGIANYNDDAIIIFDERSMKADEADLEEKLVYFRNGSTEIDSTQEAVFREIYLSLDGLLDQAKIGHKNLSVDVFGHSTYASTEQENIRISQRRAEAVVSELIRLGLDLDGEVVKFLGMGTQSLPEIDLANSPYAGMDSARVPPFNAVNFKVVIDGRNQLGEEN